MAGRQGHAGARGKTSRRGFLMGTAMAATAVSVDPKRFLLSQCTPAAVICGPKNTAAGGYSAFCCTINGGTQQLSARDVCRRLVAG